jgi:predicted PurR-regulated permease PerM
MKEGTPITITTGTIVTAVIVLAGAWLLFFLRDLVLIVITSIVIASAMEPAVRTFMRWKFPRIAAVLALYALVIGFLIGMSYLFIPSLLGDLTNFVSSLPQYLDLLNRIGAYNEYADIFGLPSPTNISPSGIIADAQETLHVSGLFGNSFGAAATLFGGVFSFLLIFVLSFYFTMAETGVDDFLGVVTPRKYRKYALDLWERSKHKIGLWMQGQLLLGLIMGVLVYIGLTILGMKYGVDIHPLRHR